MSDNGSPVNSFCLLDLSGHLPASHLLFSQLQQVLSQTNRGQQRGTSQQQHVAFLPLAAAANRVLVANPQASRCRTGARTANRRRHILPHAGPQGPRVLHGPVTAGLRGQQGPRWFLKLWELLCWTRNERVSRFLLDHCTEELKLTHLIQAGEAGRHGSMFRGLPQIWSARWINFAFSERFQPANNEALEEVWTIYIQYRTRDIKKRSHPLKLLNVSLYNHKH